MKERMLLLDKIEPIENLIKNANNIYELVEMAIESNDTERQSAEVGSVLGDLKTTIESGLSILEITSIVC